VPSQTANRLRDGWLNDRKEGLAAQLAANIEVRRRWMESDTDGQENTISEVDEMPPPKSKRLYMEYRLWSKS